VTDVVAGAARCKGIVGGTKRLRRVLANEKNKRRGGFVGGALAARRTRPKLRRAHPVGKKRPKTKGSRRATPELWGKTEKKERSNGKD